MNNSIRIIQPLHLDQFNTIREVIETQRRAEFQKILNWFIGGFAVAIVIFLGQVVTNNFITFGAFCICLFICLLFPCVATWQIDKAYRNFFTLILLPEFIKQFNLQTDVQLAYSLMGGISESTFNSSGLFKHPTEYSSRDLISEKIGKTNFECASVFAEEINESAYGNNRQQKLTVFSGLFFIADANKNFTGRTFVIPDNVEFAFGRTGHSLQELFARHRFGSCELVSLEDPNFERDFAVYSSDQIEARYLLTPLMMQQISVIRNDWNCPLHIAFIYGKIFLAIETPTNWFVSPSVFSKVSATTIQTAHQKVLKVLGLVDQIGLNTRIWGRA